MPTTANELLGYPADARLLIINADDFGMYHAITDGILRSIKNGVVHSTSVMVPCPWGQYALRLLAENPEISFGVHLTLVSDFRDYGWGPVASRERVPTLVDQTGCFHRNEPTQAYVTEFALDEVEIEFRAQIEAVLAAGLHPTHLDWHCLGDGGRPDIFDLTFELSREYGLALRVFARERIEYLQGQGLPTNDHPLVDSTRIETEGKTATYLHMLRELPDGLNEWAVHPAIGNSEAKAIDAWWHKRAADLAFLTSPAAMDVIASEEIILLDYRPLQTVWNATEIA